MQKFDNIIWVTFFETTIKGQVGDIQGFINQQRLSGSTGLI